VSARRAIWIAGIAGVAVAATARANPVDAFGYGSRAAAMAGAQTAVTDDSSANYYNPGALVRGRDLRIDIGYRYAQPLLRMNGRDNDVDAARGFQVGLVAPAAIGPFRFAFGVALSLPDQRVTRVRSLAFDKPRWVYFDNRMQRFLFSVNLALQIVPHLYVGGGLTFMSATKGDLALKGTIDIGNADDSSLVTKIDVDLLAVRYPQAGILWEASPNVTFGLTYRHSFTLNLDQGFRIDGDIGSVGGPAVIQGGYISVQATSTDLFQPWQIAAGVAARMTRRLLLTFDLTYAAWHEFPTPAADLVIGHDLKQFESLVTLPTAHTYPPSRFHDIVIPRFAAEWRVRDGQQLGVDLRGGYSYEPTPAPEQIGESNLIDGDKHTFALGAGLELKKLGPILPRPLALDAHLAMTWLPDRVNHKLDPLDPVGDIVSNGFVVQIGLTMRSRF
jgi:long-chain fatty acid transport protein